MTTDCQCPGPGHCPRFNREMDILDYGICSGNRPFPLDPRQREKYICLWEGKPIPKDERPVRMSTPMHVEPFRDVINLPCRYLGSPNGELVQCPPCGKKRTMIKLFNCELLVKASLITKLDGIACCIGCEKYDGSPKISSSEGQVGVNQDAPKRDESGL